jgi:hypothetical protein
MKKLLMVAALSEAATGAGLLIVPTLLVRLLLGVELSGASVVIARMTGIALIALATACWPGQMNPYRGMFIYNAITTAYLAWVVVQGDWVGPLLLPVVVLHVLMTILLGAFWFKGQTTEG